MRIIKVALRVLLYVFMGVIGLLVVVLAAWSVSLGIKNSRARAQLMEKSIIQVDGHTFRDLNNNGRLDIYEDFRQDIESRVDDLLSQMTIGEKAGLLWHPPVGVGSKGQVLGRPSISAFSFFSTYDMLLNRKINHFNLFAVPGTRQHAKWYNNLQKVAEQSRLGIPVTISSDPRHGIAGFLGGDFLKTEMSEWPVPVGMAATRDSLLVAEFGAIANQEFRALGIRTALHPVADLGTEPRWARFAETFGEDAELSARLTAAYIHGFQGDSLGPESVACMTKHWPGGGPQKDGWDAHFAYGAEQIYPGDNFDYHLIPFRAAIDAGTAMIMPYYGIPVGQTSEDVGMSFNREIIQQLLREEFGYDGIVCTDWTILTRTYWGMEDYSVKERITKALDAGVDQFGGDMEVKKLLELIDEGLVSESRVDESARRILRAKFAMGLFDNPYVDEKLAAETVGRQDFMEKGRIAQRRSIVLLKNDRNILPLEKGLKIYTEGMDREIASLYATVVDTPDEADIAVLRLESPFGEGRGKSFMDRLIERFFQQGDLDFKEPELSRILQVAGKVPTIVCIRLNRPAVFPEIASAAAGVIAEFGARDDAVLDIIFGVFNPTAKLPFELPSSMDAVCAQYEDLPYDSSEPLFPFGYGLTYGEEIIADDN
jgi:beta-glucosidase